MIIPITSYLILHPQNDVRVNQQLFIKNTELSLDQKAAFFGSNIMFTIQMFFGKGDMNGRHNYTGKPALNPLLFLLFLYGLITAFHNKKNKFDSIFLIYFVIAIIPTIFTYPWENPNMLRTYTSLPAIVYFIGRGLFNSISFIQSKKYARFIIIGIFFIIAVSSLYEMRTYFIFQPLVFKQSFDQPDYLPIIRKNALQQAQ